ncbi:hypothetical protein QC763_0063480 [Podospora pseudopauciseta]|uniref:Zn(2)-C6 fungal-type domain-containing protein n=1 Tax=Podospora pseudopauciseta TaxID=2093780 RepID=A0ABR0HBV7_9PEZI|nr:hypothetical protein QC763_0063480 [Podospora pseudopauciseta]
MAPAEIGPHITDTYRLRLVTAGHFRPQRASSHQQIHHITWPKNIRISTNHRSTRLTLIMPDPDDGSPSVDSPSPAPVPNDNATTTTTTTPRVASPKGPRRRAPNRTVDGGPPACVKCHGFKMRCIRQPDQKDCNRCINAKIECVPREPGSVGRPRLPRPPGWKRSHYKKGRRLGDQLVQSTSQAAEDLDPESSSPSYSTEATPPEPTSPAKSSAPARYGGPIIGLAGYNALLPNFDDLPHDSPASAANARGSIYTESTFKAPQQPQPPLHPLFRSTQTPPEPQPSPQPRQQQPTAYAPADQDPIEQLTRLQLQIYQHHTLAKKNEPSIRKDGNKPTGTEPLDTSWINPLFQSASLFYTILSSFAASPPDTATFLMIISIYTRLLQTFDLLADCIQRYIWWHGICGSPMVQDDKDFISGLSDSVVVTIGGVEVPRSVKGSKVALIDTTRAAHYLTFGLMGKIWGVLDGWVGGEDMVVKKGAMEGVGRLEEKVRENFVRTRWRKMPERGINRLKKGRVRVAKQHLKVLLVPGTGLGRRLEGIGLPAEAVITNSRAVGSTIRLTAGLDPDEGISQLEAGVGRGGTAEAGTVDVAPVTPLLAETLDTAAASVDDGVVGHAGGLEALAKGVDVSALVLARVVLGVGGGGELAGGQVPGVPAGHVGGDATELLRAAGGLVGLGELLGAGLEVGVPAEPAAVAGVDVLDDVGKVERLERVGDTVAVAGGRVAAGLNVGVGDQVGERIGLNDERDGGVGVGLEDGGDALTQLLVPVELANLQLTVGSLGSAITAGKIVDDDTEDLVARNLGESGLEPVNIGDGVEPDEGTGVGNLAGGSLEGGVGKVGDGELLNLLAVEVVGVEGVLLEDVGLGVEGDGRGATSLSLGGLVLGGRGRGGNG